MPYKVEWLIDNEIVLSILWGEMTVDELRALLTEAAELLSC